MTERQCYVMLQTVQEYERAVILRLGRCLPGGAKGPGMKYICFFKSSLYLLFLHKERVEQIIDGHTLLKSTLFNSH